MKDVDEEQLLERQPSARLLRRVSVGGKVHRRERSRALRDALLVLEDRAADVHNPGYAAQLLDQAEAGLPRERRSPARPGARP